MATERESDRGNTVQKHQGQEMLAGPPGSSAAAYETGHKSQVEALGLTPRGQAPTHDTQEEIGSAATPDAIRGGAQGASQSAPETVTVGVATDANEGEGSRTAGRRYNEATTAYAQSGRVEAAASQAAAALDGPEAKPLRAAEQQARQG
jgi:hypothetical protein